MLSPRPLSRIAGWKRSIRRRYNRSYGDQVVASERRHKMTRAATAKCRDLSQWEPTWEPGEVIPHQGCWTEEEYLSLTTNRLVEFSGGFLEIPPVPTVSHQQI